MTHDYVRKNLNKIATNKDIQLTQRERNALHEAVQKINRLEWLEVKYDDREGRR